MKTWLVTGGAGFIGSCFIRMFVGQANLRIVNLDAMTYAANRDAIPSQETEIYCFEHQDIRDQTGVARILTEYQPQAVIHFAAETHVDRSITGPSDFVESNVVGTTNLLECCRSFLDQLSESDRSRFRFLYISTDEVYGSAEDGQSFTEDSSLAANSPYAASKAAGDLFIRSYINTYRFPAIITHCSNNYGPYQFPEKLIPLMIQNLVRGLPLPIYGTGKNVRNWIHVEDHCRALELILNAAKPGSIYNIGGDTELSNLEVVHSICDYVDEMTNRPRGSSRSLIRFVNDRPGHDLRYSIDSSKLRRELAWKPSISFQTGLKETVRWYLSTLE